MLQWFSDKKKKGVAWLLLFLLCFAIVEVPVKAEAGYDGIGLVDDNFIPETTRFEMVGRHVFTDGKGVWTYQTQGFNVASDRCADVSNPPSTVKVTRLNLNQNLSKLEVKGKDMFTISTYVMIGYDFAKVFQSLHTENINKAAALGQKTVELSVFFNNIFKVVYRTDPGVTGYYTDAPMYPVYSTKSEEYHTAKAIAANPYVSSWTAAKFAGFYNYEYKFTVPILEATINYVDKKTGKDIRPSVAKVYGVKGGTGKYTLPEKTIMEGDKKYVYEGTYLIDSKNGANPELASSRDGNCSWTFKNDYMEIDVYFTEKERNKVPIRILTETGNEEDGYKVIKTEDYPTEMFEGEEFNYTPADTYIDANGKECKYRKEWRYTYTDADGNVKNSGNNPGGSVNPKIYSLPEVKEGTTLDVYVRYEKEPPKVKIKINTSVSEDGKNFLVTKTEAYGETLKSGDSFSYTAPATYKSGSKIFNYMKEWYYTYINPSGANKKVKGTGSQPSIPALPKVKEDTELNVYIKYGLSPTPTEGPTPTESPDPTATPLPTATPTPSPSPTPTPARVPSSNQTAPENLGVVSREVPKPTSAAVIESEVKGNQRYEAKVAIATQEDLYAEGAASEFILGYNFRHITGVKNYPIKVKKTYILSWKGYVSPGGGAPAVLSIISDEVEVETYVNVVRGYGYWEIDNFRYFSADNMTLTNYALPNGQISMPVISSRINPPPATTSDFTENMIDPYAYTNGIVLPTEGIYSGTFSRPPIPYADFETLAWNAAHTQTGNILVRNDSVQYDNMTVLNSAWDEISAPVINQTPLNRYIGPTTNGIFYKGNMIIDAKKNNGAFASNGIIRYKASTANINSAGEQSYVLSRPINNVILHTPVYCEGVVTEDNDKYVQLIDPMHSAVHLVLDEDSTLNDFVVSVNNTGQHAPYLGYGIRDYRNILRSPDSDLSNIERTDSGLLRNEVRFPFDVFMDVENDNGPANDIFYPAGTWFTLGTASQRFYIPMTVKEGMYSAEFRTIAVNANGRITTTQANANTDRSKYVATDTVTFVVSGRMYGLNVYDINDYPIWEEVFRIPKMLHFKINDQDKYPLGVNNITYSRDSSYNYAVGTKDRYGNDTGREVKYTLPLVAGSHPYYGNIGILKRGYTARFTLDTIGTYYDDNTRVVARPTYYWVDKNGQNRTKVDLYYSAEIAGKSRSLVKVGESIDLANIKKYTVGDRYLGIPEEEIELTATIRGISSADWRWQRGTMLRGVASIILSAPFRTFKGTAYANSILSGSQWDRMKSAGITKTGLLVTKQSWYGETFIPGTAMAVEAGTDVFEYARRYGIDYDESFWKKDGYIIVNMEIRTVDSDGNERLSYVNKHNEALYCNMWRMENAPISKASTGGPTFTFEDGDILIYSVEQSAIDDYVVGGIY